MNWRSIATCLGISEQTLRWRIEFGVENNFTDIMDEELDREIQQTLNLMPYSGETYAMLEAASKVGVYMFNDSESEKAWRGYMV